MRNTFIALFAAVTAAATTLSVVSCAKVEPEDTRPLETRAFEAWMEKYAPTAVRQPNGMYIELDQSGVAVDAPAVDEGAWMSLEYTGSGLPDDAGSGRGNVFITRSEAEALRQGSFTPHTYYTPEFIFYGTGAGNIVGGMRFAFENELKTSDGTDKLREGSKAKLYIPSYLAYGTNGFSDDQGYGGQFQLYGTKAVIEQIEIVEVVDDPVTREETLVKSQAEDKWGLSPADTLDTHFIYIDSLNFTPSTELLASFPEKAWDEKYGLTADSTATIWFTGRFLPTADYPDGFVFDTNIESVYNTFYGRNPKYPANTKESFDALSYKPVADKGSYIQALFAAVPRMRRGLWYRIVFTSAYGYGSAGRSKKLQDEQAYQQAYLDYMYNMYYNSSMYGGYYGDYYGGAYFGGGYNQGSTSEDSSSITTEIQPYTPLIFEIYIETKE